MKEQQRKRHKWSSAAAASCRRSFTPATPDGFRGLPCPLQEFIVE